MFRLLAALLIATSLSACQEDETKTAFVSQCKAGLGDEALCNCVYNGLKDSFSEPQMVRISTLFSMNVPQSMSMLQESGTEDDLSILERIHDIERVAEGCF